MPPSSFLGKGLEGRGRVLLRRGGAEAYGQTGDFFNEWGGNRQQRRLVRWEGAASHTFANGPDVVHLGRRWRRGRRCA